MGRSAFGAFWGFGQKALRREEESTLCFLREFCAMRKTSPPVTALPLSHCSSSARVLSCGRLLRRIRAHTFVCLTESAATAWGKQKSPGWPASNFRVLSPRVIYGTFCPGPIYPSKAGRRRRMRRRWRQRTTQPCALQSYEEKRTFSQLIRHRQKMPQAFFAGCRGKRAFCVL